MKEIVCIVCPNGCRLAVDDESGALAVSGNECPRGVAFARAEMTAPMRTITGTVATIFSDFPLLPVKTEGEFKKELLGEAAARLSRIVVRKRVKAGEVVAEDFFGTRLLSATDMFFSPPARRINTEDDNV